MTNGPIPLSESPMENQWNQMMSTVGAHCLPGILNTEKQSR